MKLIITQETVNHIFNTDSKYIHKFEKYGQPEVKENELTGKYYKYNIQDNEQV